MALRARLVFGCEVLVPPLSVLFPLSKCFASSGAFPHPLRDRTGEYGSA
jgi:hypothetical protein